MNKSKADVGRKPYGDGFADLLRFCRNAYEHPPTGTDEIEPMVIALMEASLAVEASAEAAVAAEAAARESKRVIKEQQRQRQRQRSATPPSASESTAGNGDRDRDVEDAEVEVEVEVEGSEKEEKRGKMPSPGRSGRRDTRFYALLPPGVIPGMAYRRLTRKQRRALFASYILHLFPALPLAVHECALAAGPDESSASVPGHHQGAGAGAGVHNSWSGRGGPTNRRGGGGSRKTGNNRKKSALSSKPPPR